MDIIELIFKLVRAHVPISQEDYGRLYEEANAWKAPAHTEHENKLLALFAKVHKPWIVRLIIVVAYIPLTRWIYKLKSVEIQEDKETF